MIESPLLQEFEAKATCRARRKDIVQFLQARYGPVPPELTAALQGVEDEAKLDELVELAARCPDLDSFRAGLTP